MIVISICDHCHSCLTILWMNCFNFLALKDYIIKQQKLPVRRDSVDQDIRYWQFHPQNSTVQIN